MKISLTQPLKFSLNRKKAGLFWIKFGFYRENDVERDCFQINVTGFLIVERKKYRISFKVPFSRNDN